MKAQILAFCNHKGGCGKTTSAVNVAAGLAQRGRSVLLADLDPQANTTQAFGLDPYNVPNTIYDALRDKCTLKDTIQEVGNIHVVPSCLDLTAAETQLVSEYNRERLLSELLGTVADKYDFILIDCPPSLGLLTINALTAAHRLIIPVQPHFFAVQGLQQLLEVVAKVKRGLNKQLAIGGVFLTDYDGRVKMHNDAAEAVAAAFPDEMFNTKIRHNVALSESAAQGETIFAYNPKSNGAQDYAALSEEIDKRFSARY